MKKIRLFALAAASLFSISTTHANVGLDDIQFWAGSGTNRAGLVIDWNDGKSAESFAWGYRWNGTATGFEMLQAIVIADPRLYANVSPPTQFGISVYGLGYDLNGNNLFGTSPSLSFDGDGWVVGSPDDSRAPADASDHWQEGWNFSFWGYDIRTTSGSPWGFSNDGPSDRILSDGVWDGYSFAPGFNFTDPSEPALAPVPEPSVFALTLAGGIALLRRRSRKDGDSCNSSLRNQRALGA